MSGLPPSKEWERISKPPPRYEWKAPPCWVCGRPKKGEWHAHPDKEQRFPLCWFCAGEVNERFCDFDHEKCGWWKDYTCTRQITLEEMRRLKQEIQREGVGGFKFVKEDWKEIKAAR